VARFTSLERSMKLKPIETGAKGPFQRRDTQRTSIRTSSATSNGALERCSDPTQGMGSAFLFATFQSITVEGYRCHRLKIIRCS
jgi:hypothetical protein